MHIQEGYYDAVPTCCGSIRTKNGYDQFAIEVKISLRNQETGEIEHKLLTKFCGLSADISGNSDKSPLEYTMQDAETVGCDTSGDFGEWMVDPKKKLRVHVVVDPQYGAKLKSIFPFENKSGALIEKMALPAHEKSAVASMVNAKIAALRARHGKASDDSDIPF